MNFGVPNCWDILSSMHMSNNFLTFFLQPMNNVTVDVRVDNRKLLSC